MAATIDSRLGWEVRLDMAPKAASTTSTPASEAKSRDAACTPGVSWVCRWMGRPISLRRADTSFRAAKGRRRPDMSLMPMMVAPAFSRSFAICT
jgi:hypothetical protein